MIDRVKTLHPTTRHKLHVVTFFVANLLARNEQTKTRHNKTKEHNRPKPTKKHKMLNLG